MGLITIFFEINTGEVFGRIYKYIQRNWPYPPAKYNLVLPHRSDISVQTQKTSACGASVYAHALESDVSHQRNSYHANTDVNDNNY